MQSHTLNIHMMPVFMQIKTKEDPRGLVAIAHKHCMQQENREKWQITLKTVAGKNRKEWTKIWIIAFKSFI